MKTKKKQQVNPDCFTQVPPWKTAKSKHRAWDLGYYSGRAEGIEMTESKYAKEKEQLQMQKKNMQLQAIDKMSHALECMTRALAEITK